MARYTKAEAREWARAEMRGVCNVIIPSYTADLRGLNEAGIRHDVRRDLELGFRGALVVSETAVTPDEYVRMTEWAADESAGRLVLFFHASFNTLEENIEVAKRAEDAGAEAESLADDLLSATVGIVASTLVVTLAVCIEPNAGAPRGRSESPYSTRTDSRGTPS